MAVVTRVSQKTLFSNFASSVESHFYSSFQGYLTCPCFFAYGPNTKNCSLCVILLYITLNKILGAHMTHGQRWLRGLLANNFQYFSIQLKAQFKKSFFGTPLCPPPLIINRTNCHSHSIRLLLCVLKELIIFHSLYLPRFMFITAHCVYTL